MNLDDYLDSNSMDGYAPGAPSSGLIDAAGVDAEVCAESRCAECGHIGLEYRPFVKRGSYRAFAVCPVCGATEEF